MKFIFTKIFLLIAVTFTSFAAFPTLAHAIDCDANGDGVVSTQEAIQCGAGGASGGQDPQKAGSNVNTLIKTGINLLTVVVGIAAVVMIIIAGFRYITSGGTSEKVTSAKNTITYAVVGLIIVALAQIIVRFVLTTATTDCVNHKTPTGQACQ